MRRFLALGAAVLTIAAGLVIMPTAAFASCSTPSAITPTLSGREVARSATGHCSTYGNLHAILYHYYDFVPDALVSDKVDSVDKSGGSLYAAGAQCDNGGSTTYYTKAKEASCGPSSNGAILICTFVYNLNSKNVVLNHC